MTAPVRRRLLGVSQADALGWDAPEGHGGDPPELAGRAALAARYLAFVLSRSRPGGGADVAGWVRRHRLERDGSYFSFWSPEAGQETLRAALAGLDLEPDADLLSRLAAAQLAQARRQAGNPVAVLLRAAECAGWGAPAHDPLGNEGTLAALSPKTFGTYLERWVRSAHIVDTTVPLPSPAGRQAAAVDDDTAEAGTVGSGTAEAEWLGGLVTEDRPGLQCRLAVRLRMAGHADDPAAAAVLAELLDGGNGLLHRRLRDDAGLAYGVLATSYADPGGCSVLLSASLLRERLPEGVAAFGDLVAEVGYEDLPLDPLRVAGARVQDRELARLDDPFGALDDYRARAAGRPGSRRAAEDAAQAVGVLVQGPRLSEHRPAVAYVGPVDDEVHDLLAPLRAAHTVTAEVTR